MLSSGPLSVLIFDTNPIIYILDKMLPEERHQWMSWLRLHYDLLVYPRTVKLEYLRDPRSNPGDKEQILLRQPLEECPVEVPEKKIEEIMDKFGLDPGESDAFAQSMELIGFFEKIGVEIRKIHIVTNDKKPLRVASRVFPEDAAIRVVSWGELQKRFSEGMAGLEPVDHVEG